MKRMKTLMPHEYDSKQLDVGDEFDCEEAHVELLTAMKRAEIIAEPPQQYMTRDMAAVSPQPYSRKQLPRSAKGRTP